MTAIRDPSIIAGLLILTSTPGISAPVVSSARPVTAPVVACCASAGIEMSIMRARSGHTILFLLVIAAYPPRSRVRNRMFGIMLGKGAVV